MRPLFVALPVTLCLALLLGIGWAQRLPESQSVERSLTIRASPSTVYGHVAHIRRWPGWYIPPGSGRFEGPEDGTGGTLILFDEEAREVRRLELVSTSSPSEVVYRFPNQEQVPFAIEGRFEFARDDAGYTRVTSRQALTALADSGNWFGTASERWFLFLMADRFVGSILDRELHNLKGVVEGLPPPLPAQ